MEYYSKNKRFNITLSILLIVSLLVPVIPSVTNANEENINSSAPSVYDSIQPGIEWTDTNGEVITAHGGSVQRMNEAELGIDFTGDGEQVQDVWVWYGEDKTNATRPVDGVKLYISEDLNNWTDMGAVLHTHDKLPAKLNSSGDELEFDADSLAELKEWGNLTESTEDVSESQISMAKDFLEAYVTVWDDNENRIAQAYDEDSLRVAFENLYGRYNIVERPKVIYNEQTGKYVLVYHADGPQYTSSAIVDWVRRGANPDDINTGGRYGRAQVGFAEADTPLGPFKLVNATRMNWTEGVSNPARLGESRDMTVFVDYASGLNDDGGYDAYVVYATDNNFETYISLLNPEYTGPAVEGGEAIPGVHYNYNVLANRPHREAPVVFYHDGYYHMLTSGANGWNSTDVIHYRSKSMILSEGQTWERVGDPFAESGTRGYDSQPTNIITVDAEKGQFIYMGDRWKVSSNGSAGSDSRYVWLPIQLGSDHMLRIEYYDSWKPTDEWVYEQPQVELGKLQLNTDVVLYGDEYSITTTVTNNSDANKEITVIADVPIDWNTEAVTLEVDSLETKEVTIPVNPPAEGGTELLKLAVSALDGRRPVKKEVEVLAVPKATDSVFALDAGTAASPVFEEYNKLSPNELWDAEKGYGWIGTVPDSRDRGVVDSLRRDLIAAFQPATLGLYIPAGEHTIHVLSGDRQFSQANTAITVDGNIVAETAGTADGEFKVLSFDVSGGEAGKEVEVQFSGVSGRHWVVNAVVVKENTPTDEEMPTTVADILTLLERFKAEGEFANDGTAKSLQAHLNTANRFEQRGEMEKPVYHLNNFKELLDHHKNQQHISKEAYEILITNVMHLLEKWELDN